jgi:hypothetical protein
MHPRRVRRRRAVATRPPRHNHPLDHPLEGEAAERAFAAVREAIAQRRGESVLVARRGWRAVAYRLDPQRADCTQDLLAGADLAAALERAGDAFDFAAWLAAALRDSWLKAVVASGD